MITFTYHNVIDGHLLKPETPKRNHLNHQNSYKNSNKTIETASVNDSTVIEFRADYHE